MADELKFNRSNAADRDSLDESLVAAIRDAYAAPGGGEYWAALEQRIMARVSSGEVTETPWWSVLAPWTRPALVAAAALIAAAGLIDRQMVDSDSQLAYDSVIESSTAGVAATSEEIMSVENGADGATLSYFLSH